MNLDVLQKTVGFQNIQKAIKNYKHTAQQSLHIQDLGRNCVNDREKHATKPKKNE